MCVKRAKGDLQQNGKKNQNRRDVQLEWNWATSYQERKAKKWEEAKTPELTLELDEEARPSINDISWNTTEIETVPQETAYRVESEDHKGMEITCKIEENAPKESKYPEIAAIIVKATTS